MTPAACLQAGTVPVTAIPELLAPGGSANGRSQFGNWYARDMPVRWVDGCRLQTVLHTCCGARCLYEAVASQAMLGRRRECVSGILTLFSLSQVRHPG